MDVIGTLDEVIYLEQPSLTVSENGERTTAWIAFADVWAERIYMGGDEKTEARELTALNIQKFRIRYKSATHERMRVRDAGNNIYDIHHIEVQGRNQWMILTTEWKDRTEYKT